MTDRLRLGIVGCGDVVHRHYLPGIITRSDRVAITALADPGPGAAASVASAVSGWSPDATTYPGVEEMLDAETLDGVFNLTPAPVHGPVNRTILEAGVACFSEKPLASTISDADALIDLAARKA
ncbi:MAG: Gfo/Idh/MocA family protein, partial [Chloroflexota bacterium]